MTVDEKDLPKFAKIGNTAMRLIPKKSRSSISLMNFQYWRDAGRWGTNVMKNSSGQLISSEGWPVVPITREEWKKDNEEYV